MKLHELKPAKGSKKNRRRVGRGIGSGRGKTAGRGTKGQNSRSGGGVHAGFEGGQMPLQRRLPKLGFTNIFRTEYEIINLDTITKFGLEGDIDAKRLVERGIIDKGKKLKVLGRGEISAGITITADKFSKTARDKIEKAGGKAVEG